MKRFTFYIGLFLLLALVSYGIINIVKPNDTFVNRFQNAVVKASKSASPHVNVSSSTDFEWDYLYIYGPYTSLEKINQQLGSESKAVINTHIDFLDTINVLVFVKNSAVIRCYKVPRNVDFQGLDKGNVFTRQKDAFEIRSVPEGKYERLICFPRGEESMRSPK